MNLQIAQASKRFRNFFFDNFVIFVILVGINQFFSFKGFWATVVVSLCYYVLFEFFLGKTPGKMNTKTRVVMADGSKVTLQAVVIRSVARLIPLEGLSFLSSKNPVGWHDKFSNTKVVEE